MKTLAVKRMENVILVVDPVAERLTTLRRQLNTGEWNLMPVLDGESALHRIESVHPKLILLSELIDGDALEWVRLFREKNTTIPVIIFSDGNVFAHALVNALNGGADDYLDISQSKVLHARINAILRRYHTPDTTALRPMFKSHGMTYNSATRNLTINNQAVRLSPTEHKILDIIVQNAPSAVPHREIIDHVWGSRSYEDDRVNLRTYICYLRQKIEVDPAKPQRILTVPWVGYRFAVGATK